MADGVDDSSRGDLRDERHHVSDFGGGGDHFDRGGTVAWLGGGRGGEATGSGQVLETVAGDEVVEGGGGLEDFGGVDAVHATADEGAFDVGAERLCAIGGLAGSA